MLWWICLLCLGFASCEISLDAHGWHRQAQGLIAGRDLRVLDRRTIAEAEYCEKQALELDSTLVEASLGLAAVYRARGAYEESDQAYRSLLAQHPDMGIAYAGLGLSLAVRGRYRAAAQAYQQALRCNERTPQVYAGLGHTYQAVSLQAGVLERRRAQLAQLGHGFQRLGQSQTPLLVAEETYRASLQADPSSRTYCFIWRGCRYTWSSGRWPALCTGGR